MFSGRCVLRCVRIQPAGVAQLVEQLIRNQQVVGSSPTAGSSFPKKISIPTSLTTSGISLGNRWVQRVLAIGRRLKCRATPR